MTYESANEKAVFLNLRRYTALRVPVRTIAGNAGVEGSVVVEKVLASNEAGRRGFRSLSTDPPPPRLIGWNIRRPTRRPNDVCVGQ